MSDEMTPRERRAARAGNVKPKRAPIKWGKAAGPVAIIVLLGLVFGVVYMQSGKIAECPGHWHSSFHVYVFDERIDYGSDNHYTLENKVLPFSRHMHAGEGGTQVHWEPPRSQCQGMGAFLKSVETELTRNSITLEGHHTDLGQAGAHKVGDPVPGTNDTAELNVYIQVPKETDARLFDGQYNEWKQISVSKFLDRQPLNGEKQLIVFGAPTPERLQEMQAGVPVPPATGLANAQHPAS